MTRLPPEWVHTTPGVAPALSDDRDVHAWLLAVDDPRLRHPHLIDALSDDERERARRYARIEDRRRFETARALLRHLLAKYTAQAPGAIRFTQGRHGKPSLAEEHGVQRPSFNASRSGPYALVAITRTADIGVDIEARGTEAEYEGVATDYFAAQERLQLGRLALHRRFDGFLAGWTRKEAVLKALGSGLQTPPDGVVVSLDPDAPPALHAIDGCSDPSSAWTLWSAPLQPGAWTAVAVHRSHARIQQFLLADAAPELWVSNPRSTE